MNTSFRDPAALLVLRFEDMFGDSHERRAKSIHLIAAHLSLTVPFPPAAMPAGPSTPHKNPPHTVGGDMLNETWHLLKDFYAPYNEALARELGDHYFHWSDSRPARRV